MPAVGGSGMRPGPGRGGVVVAAPEVLLTTKAKLGLPPNHGRTSDPPTAAATTATPAVAATAGGAYPYGKGAPSPRMSSSQAQSPIPKAPHSARMANDGLASGEQTAQQAKRLAMGILSSGELTAQQASRSSKYGLSSSGDLKAQHSVRVVKERRLSSSGELAAARATTAAGTTTPPAAPVQPLSHLPPHVPPASSAVAPPTGDWVKALSWRAKPLPASGIPASMQRRRSVSPQTTSPLGDDRPPALPTVVSMPPRPVAVRATRRPSLGSTSQESKPQAVAAVDTDSSSRSTALGATAKAAAAAAAAAAAVTPCPSRKSPRRSEADEGAGGSERTSADATATAVGDVEEAGDVGVATESSPLGKESEGWGEEEFPLPLPSEEFAERLLPAVETILDDTSLSSLRSSPSGGGQNVSDDGAAAAAGRGDGDAAADATADLELLAAPAAAVRSKDGGGVTKPASATAITKERVPQRLKLRQFASRAHAMGITRGNVVEEEEEEVEEVRARNYEAVAAAANAANAAAVGDAAADAAAAHAVAVAQAGAEAAGADAAAVADAAADAEAADAAASDAAAGHADTAAAAASDTVDERGRSNSAASPETTTESEFGASASAVRALAAAIVAKGTTQAAATVAAERPSAAAAAAHATPQQSSEVDKGETKGKESPLPVPPLPLDSCTDDNFGGDGDGEVMDGHEQAASAAPILVKLDDPAIATEPRDICVPVENAGKREVPAQSSPAPAIRGGTAAAVEEGTLLTAGLPGVRVEEGAEAEPPRKAAEEGVDGWSPAEVFGSRCPHGVQLVVEYLSSVEVSGAWVIGVADGHVLWLFFFDHLSLLLAVGM